MVNNNLNVIRENFKNVYIDAIEEDLEALKSSIENSINENIETKEGYNERYHNFERFIQGWDDCFCEWLKENELYNKLDEEEQDFIKAQGHGLDIEFRNALNS